MLVSSGCRQIHDPTDLVHHGPMKALCRHLIQMKIEIVKTIQTTGKRNEIVLLA